MKGLGAPLRRWLGRTVPRLGGAVQADVRNLQAQIDESHARLSSLSRSLDSLSERLASYENASAIEAFSRFVRHSRLNSLPLVSVVIPTYERPDRLRRAIESVLAQRYARWELLVVDDGGQLDSRRVVEEVEDPRVKWQRIEHAGAGAARNAALSIATGELIAYLDDDNVMDVDWLYAVVWAFEHHPDVEVAYGAIVIDDVSRANGQQPGGFPQAFLHPWSRARLREGNLADMGAIAHRAGLPEARFDETLTTVADWDLLIRLTAERDPLVLPAIACYYNTDVHVRLSGGPTQPDDIAKVKARAALIDR
jgi:glycosyltransferase involved in cell wall biosynthesis